MSFVRSFVAVSTLFVLSAPLHAQVYPAKPIRVIVPYAAGGFSDLISRVVGERMARVLHVRTTPSAQIDFDELMERSLADEQHAATSVE